MPKLSKEQEELIERVHATIEETMDNGGQYAHNKISAALRTVAAKCGNEEANKIVRWFELDIAYGIQEHTDA